MLSNKIFITSFCSLFLLCTACTKTGHKASEVLMPKDENSMFSASECYVIHGDSIRTMNQVENGPCITIHIPDCNILSVSDTIIESYEFIPLESNPECMIGQVSKVLKCKDCFCVFDRDNSNAFLFNLDGSLRCKLGEKGHTKQEYLRLYNVAYNAREEFISLLDLDGRKIMDYNMDGKLMAVHPLYFLYTALEYDNDCIVCNTGLSYNSFSSILDCHKLTLADSLQRPIAHAFKYGEQIRDAFTFSPIIKKTDDCIYYDDRVSDTIWQIRNQQITPVVEFLCDGRHRFSSEDIRDMSDQKFNSCNAESRHCVEWLMMKDYMLFTIAYPYKGMNLASLLIYSKNSRRYKVFGHVEKVANLGDGICYNYMDTWGRNSFVSVVEPVEILENCRKIKLAHSLTVKEKELVDGLSTDSNPVLLITTIQDF